MVVNETVCCKMSLFPKKVEYPFKRDAVRIYTGGTTT